MITERAEMYLFFLLAPLTPVANYSEMIMRSEKIVVSKTFFSGLKLENVPGTINIISHEKTFFYQRTQIYIFRATTS